MNRDADNLVDVTWVAWCAEWLREQWPRADGTSLEEALKLTSVAPDWKSALEYTADQLIAAKKAGKNSLVYVGGASRVAKDQGEQQQADG